MKQVMKPILRILYIFVGCIVNTLIFVLSVFAMVFMFIFAAVSYIITGKTNAHLFLEYVEKLNHTLDKFIEKFNPDK